MGESLMLPLTGAGLGVVVLSALPAVVAIVAQVRNRTPKDNFYEDRDGKATPQSISAFSNRRPKLIILSSSIIGLGTSIAISVLSALHQAQYGFFLENWLMTAAWGFIVIHAVSLGAHHSSVQSYDLGMWLFASAAVVASIAIIQLSTLAQQIPDYRDPVVLLRAVNSLAPIALGFASASLPRRPDVFHKGIPVDRQSTVSAIHKYSWNWIGPLIELASKKNDLDAEDVPAPDRRLRSEDIQKDWDAFHFKGGLLRSLIWAHKGAFAFQWGATVFRAFIGILPFWTMLQLIRILEQRGGGGSPTLELWNLVIWMALFNMLDAWIEGWVYWYSYSDLALPVRSELSTLVFEKSLRRKNVKAADKSTESGTEENQGDIEKDDDKDGDSSVLKSRQSIVNLVGVDAARISNFVAYQFLIVNSVAKLTIFSAFLIQMIGWIPFGAGLLTWAVIVPFNTWFSNIVLTKSDKLMKQRDEKLAMVNEALIGMRQIKFSALEEKWEKRIIDLRERELKTLWGAFIGETGLYACWIVSPILLAASSLAVYAYMNGGLSPSVAFVSIGVFKALEVTLIALPELLTMGIDTLVSIKRIDTYLNGPEMEKTLTEGPEVSFENASISWPVDEDVADEDRFILRNLNLTFPTGELSVISGKTGTGKSLVLSAILGETDLLGGEIRVPSTLAPDQRRDNEAHPGDWIIPGAVAYVSQTPWLESASLRDNITFGLPFYQERYRNVLDVCALKKDLKILPDGDRTELGANGINLSGGQKWRVTLARAIYSRAEILVMDDIFSAVDAHVGRHIYEKCVTGEICKGRTRILVTHHVALVQPKAKFVVELGEGTVLHSGLVADLIKDGTMDEIRQHEEEQIENLDEEMADISTVVNSEQVSVTSSADEMDENPLQKLPSKDAKQFIQEEVRQKGVVKKHVYLTYLKDSGGLRSWSLCAVIFLAFQIGILGRSWWLRIWTAQSPNNASKVSIHEEHGAVSMFSLKHQYFHLPSDLKTAEDNDNLTFYLCVYVGISLATAVVGTLRFLFGYILALRASRALFRKMLFTVLRTPLRWIDTVPVGRILNRFTADFNVIDSSITNDWTMFIANLLGLIGVCVAAFFASGYVVPLAGALIVVGMWIARSYLFGARPLKRLDSNAKSPVFEVFNAALSGVTTIRGYQKTQVYIDRMYHKLDRWAMMTSYMWLVTRWMGFRMTIVGTIFSTVVGIIVIRSSSMDAALAGFTLSFALDFSENILWTLRNYANMELNMNSTERVVEYTELETESQGGQKPPASWPKSGDMEVKKLEVSYASDLPPVLRDISFKVKNNERVGVVGRTGAGKSSLTLALFRFLEARSGSVVIDGIDISKIDLHSLRSRLAIIPQDPVLFSGTIRSNLDPFEDNTDDELRDSLARVHLVDSQPATPNNEPSSAAGSMTTSKNVNIFRDLSSPISESGGNLSQGQRQLLCLARAIVARPKIMVLDEATSAVDMATDALIQRSIREEFNDSTLIVIAHRLSTIADFDRILVLSEGRVAEFGAPRDLWEKNGIFRDMCESSGEKETLEETIFQK